MLRIVSSRQKNKTYLKLHEYLLIRDPDNHILRINQTVYKLDYYFFMGSHIYVYRKVITLFEKLYLIWNSGGSSHWLAHCSTLLLSEQPTTRTSSGTSIIINNNW
jgi:hypothetical protein